MAVKWTNVLCLGLVLAAFLIYLKTPAEIEFWPRFDDYSPHGQLKQFIYFGVSVVALVAIVSIIVKGKRGSS